MLLLCITQFRAGIYWNRDLAAFYLFHIVTQSIRFYKFHCHISKSTDVWTGWLINPWSNIPKNERLLLSASFTPKFELVFVLTQENVRGFFSKSRERAQVILRNGTGEFQNGHPFERSATAGNEERFQYFTLKQIFWKWETFFKKWSTVSNISVQDWLVRSQKYKMHLSQRTEFCL